MDSSRTYGFILLSLACIYTVYANDACVRKSTCECVFPNGTGIDLSPAAVSTTFYSAKIYMTEFEGSQYKMMTYYYHPCFDVNMTVTDKTAKSTCTGPLALCRHVVTMQLKNGTNSTFDLGEPSYDFLGMSKVSNFSDQANFISYQNGPSETIVLLQCAPTDDHLQIYSLEEPNKLALAFYSRHACLKQLEEVGRSFGSTLLIIFFSFLIFYLVLGICTKKFLMGATGIEVIPNLGFWTELPNLVKDGWLFMSNGFRLPARASGQTVSPDPNSYDSI